LLDDVWKERLFAYLAEAAPGFSNFFMLNVPSSPVCNFSLIMTAELQFDHVMKLIERVRRGDLDFALPSNEAAARFESERVEAAKNTVSATG
jgi:hypothetical protein